MRDNRAGRSRLGFGYIPHGTVYLILPEQTASTRRRDFENICRLGLNTVVLWPPVSRWDAGEPGGLAFDSVDQVIDLCGELGLKAIIELQGQTDNHGPVPEYLPFASEWPNINHPDIRRATSDFMRKVAAHFKGHPALLAYDVYNEVGYTGTDPFSLEEFALFAERQYHADIGALNRAWGTYHRAFGEIPKHGSNFRRRVWRSGLMQRDWYRFLQLNFALRLREWTAAIREVDETAIVFADILGCDTMHNRCQLGANDWLTANESDVHGLSCYANMLGSDWKQCDAYAFSQFWRQQRSAARGKQVIISELMTHNRTMFPAERSSMTDQLRLWSYQALFNGIQGIIYWQYRPFDRGLQVSGRGLTDYEGQPNALAAQAKETAAFSTEYAALLQSSRPDDAGLAILHDHNAQDIYAAIQSWDASFYTDAERGLYRGFWEHGIAARYLLPEDLAAGVPSYVRVLAIPCCVALAAGTGAALKAFVERGGVLFTEGRFALLDENAFLHERVPGCGLADAFGVREQHFICDAEDIVEAEDTDAKDTVDAQETGEPGALHIEDYLQLLSLAESVQVVARTKKGRPALVANRIGQGLYVHAPLLLGRLIQRGTQGALALFQRAFHLVQPSLRPALATRRKEAMVDVSVLVDEHDVPTLLGICNYRHEPTTVELMTRANPRTLAGCQAVQLQQQGENLHVLVPAREAVALLF